MEKRYQVRSSDLPGLFLYRGFGGSGIEGRAVQVGAKLTRSFVPGYRNLRRQSRQMTGRLLCFSTAPLRAERKTTFSLTGGR